MKSRLTEIADYVAGSTRSFEVACGLQRGNIGNMSDDGAIGSDKLAKIIDAFPFLDVEWILTGKGEMIKADIDKASLKPGVEAKKKIKIIPAKNNEGIPLIPINAMAGYFAGEIQINATDCDYYVVPLFKEAEFLIPVKGSSMYPKYNSGDIVACKRVPLDTFFQWNKVYVLDTEQGALVKRIKKGETDDTITIISDNPKYEPFILQKSKIFAIAIVVGVIRQE